MRVKDCKAYQYAQSVLSGEQIAGKYIIKACQRFMNDLERDDLIFDLDEVKKVTDFFEKVLYVPELGKPVELPLPHAFWIQQLYGFKYVDTGLRRFDEMVLIVARKNAKTFYAGGICLYELLCGNDPFPDVMVGANSRDQAIICTNMVGRIVHKSKEINQLVKNESLLLFTQKKKTTTAVYEDGDREGRIDAMPRDVGDGGNPSATVTDEFHEATDLDFLETMKSGQGARDEPFNLIISSPGSNKSGPLYSVLRDQATKMLDGIIEDDKKLALLFEQDKEEDWDNPEFAEKANPMMPYIKTLRGYWQKRIKEAKNKGGATQVSVKIKNCGVWADAPEVWLAHEVLKKNVHGITFEELKGKECYLGIDLSKSLDLTAIVYYFPDVRPGIHAVYPQCYIPFNKILDNTDGVDYRLWVDKGLVIAHDGDVIRHDMAARDTIELMKNFRVMRIGYDSKMAYPSFLPILSEAGFEDFIEPIGQGFPLNQAVVDVENMIILGNFDLMDNPVTLWNFGNVVMKVGDQGHRFPSKSKSTNKIDIVSGLLTARTVFNLNQVDKPQESGIFYV